jgi:hypothetical protein
MLYKNHKQEDICRHYKGRLLTLKGNELPVDPLIYRYKYINPRIQLNDSRNNLGWNT